MSVQALIAQTQHPISASESKADSAGLAASVADSKAVSDSLNISVADSKAESVSINTSTAQSTADSGGQAASVADSKAESDSINTSTADSKAVSAEDEAESIALSQSTLISIAQSTADSGNSGASVAQSTADSSGTAASIAQSSADSAALNVDTTNNVNYYMEETYGVDGLSTTIYWTDVGKTVKILEYDYTYTLGIVTTLVVKQYTGGVLVKTNTHTYTYNVDGTLATDTNVVT